MACWWASGAPTRSELCPPVGLTCPGRAQPSPPLTPAFARPRHKRQQPPQQRHATRGARSRAIWWASASTDARTYHLPTAVTSAPWVPAGPVYEVTAYCDSWLGRLERFCGPCGYLYCEEEVQVLILPPPIHGRSELPPEVLAKAVPQSSVVPPLQAGQPVPSHQCGTASPGRRTPSRRGEARAAWGASGRRPDVPAALASCFV